MCIRIDNQPIRKTKCKSYQTYRHTHKYCLKEPRCVRCTVKLLTVECYKPKCVPCGVSLLTNYRACVIAKGIKKKTSKLRS